MEKLALYLHENYFFQAPLYLIEFLVMLIAATVVLLAFVAPFAGITSVIERKIAGRIQDRIGPNRVGPQGFLQFLADGIKSLLKEDLIPRDADQSLFRLAPYLVFLGMFTTFVALPFSGHLIVADLNVGLLYIFATSSITVVGLVMAGWGSGNKWSMLGGMRSAAQVISYEIPAGLAALTVILPAGTLSMQGIIAAQGPHPWQWYLFSNPFAFIAFFILLTALIAEGNRAPFDLPEAESELVSGYNTEYSGMRFLFFFFAEWANLYVLGAVLTTLFLGGWQIPVSLAEWTNGVGPWFTQIVQFLFFQIKALFLVFLVIQLRWTVPRVRMDQLMDLCWKYLVPIGFFCVVGVAVWMLVFQPGLIFDAKSKFLIYFPKIVSYGLVALVGLAIIYYFYRVYWQLKFTKAKLSLNPFV